MIKDISRQSLNLVLGSIMWLCSSLNLFFENARSPADMSDKNDSLLVPFGAAFSIWLPIFVLCFIYAVLQALPKNRNREIYKQLGWWTAAGFGGVCLWGIINAFAPLGNFWNTPLDYAQWGTAVIFVPTMLFLVKAMLIATRKKAQFDKFERYTVWVGLSLIAGWCSIAVFLNWTPQIVSRLEAVGVIPSWTCAALVIILCLWVRFIAIKSHGNGAYLFPVIWGLCFVLLALFTEKKDLEVDWIRNIIGPSIIILLVMPFFMKYEKPVSEIIFEKI